MNARAQLLPRHDPHRSTNLNCSMAGVPPSQASSHPSAPRRRAPSQLFFLLSLMLLILVKLSTSKNQIMKRLRVTMSEIAGGLLERTRKGRESQAKGGPEKSIIGLLSMCNIRDLRIVG
ncbi:hypothetical protein BD779DRAFT_890584 [Infundibulicybe gibba]|nr:hypothetical protein BD779DRAFT_890584 [Infundibulicybe gibba]